MISPVYFGTFTVYGEFCSFFAVVEQGYFQSIGKMVQKIMLDEIFCHYKTDVLKY